jgi:hypothetical protein
MLGGIYMDFDRNVLQMDMPEDIKRENCRI